ncbi:MAG: hypothetical protein HQL50_08550 [Magnetococcales bacterium]|nr:hypothetical protein [Magnetococcales bacterium]
MSPDYARGVSRYSLLLIGFFASLSLLLSGCSDDSGYPPYDPALIAGDSFTASVARRLQPRSYWHGKWERMEEEVRAAEASFNTARKAYHQLLMARREAMGKAMEQALREGKDLRKARSDALAERRGELDDLRQASRQAAKVWRLKRTLRDQARQVYFATLR